MSKYPKLLEAVTCEWVQPNGVLCGQTFCDMDDFTSHVKEHTEESTEAGSCNWLGCDFSSSADNQEFTHHVLFHPYHSYQKLLGSEHQRKQGLPTCQMDGETVNLLPGIEVELKCLWDEGQCGAEFESVGEFYGHVHTHAMTQRDMCCKWTGCAFCGRDKSKVLEHTRTHTHEKVTACATCGSQFASNTKLKDHLTRQVEPTDPNLACTICHKHFPNERHLREHVRRHINTVQCPHCELTCNSPSRLLHHIRFRHMENKPHECPLCQKKFKTQYALSDHIESHRQKTYECTMTGCKYSAKTLRSWQLHVKTHLPDQLEYCCHICEKRCSTGTELTAHLKKTHGFELPPGHCRFRYVAGLDGLKRLQTVRLDDDAIVTPEVSTFVGTSYQAPAEEGDENS